MHCETLLIPDVKIFSPHVFQDDRGFFYESFHHRKFEEAIGCSVTFVQDNHSKSKKNVLRGLHYQLPPHDQGKLVRVAQGEIFDVAVDLRKSSAFFGQHVCARLSDTNRKQLWVPPGFAHGFLTLSDTAEVLYKTTDYYAPDAQRSLLWNDTNLSIPWPLTKGALPLLTEKDASGTSFHSADSF